jgi:protein TonB
MRTYTLAFSILVHLLVVVGVLVVSPLVANGELPEPRRPVEFIEVVAPPVPTLPPPRSSGAARSERVNPHAAPVEAPDNIAPEPPGEPFETIGSPTGVVNGLDDGIDGSLTAIDPPPPPPPAPAAAPLRVGGSIRQPRKIHDVSPVYPALALAARKEGIVILEAEIGEDGRVRNTRLLRSIPLLDEAAIEAVRQWRFTPTLLNGEPVPVVMTVTVAFTLTR